VVVAAGGDGTVNEVVNGLAGTAAALAVLPVGTVNVWAREIGLPLEPRAAAEAQLGVQPRNIDLGRADERYFLLMASLGFDATVTAGVRSDLKRRIGAFAYVWEAFRLALRYEGVAAQVVIDGRRFRGRYLMVVLGNSQLYGGVVKLTAHAIIDDGLLDVCLIRGRSLLGAPLRLLSIMTRRHREDSRISYYRARRLKISSKTPIDVQVDGDYIGSAPTVFEVAPAALLALIPNQAPPELFQR
ncbi:MAG: diacylglycerol kinase family lipid kinase, partial [Roseiflexaceae bacterium]|nr:diacylglycerol kinase family lipid kinase [Roseiflexaceae bacterium]